MWPFPFDVGAGPLGRLHRVDIKRAVISREVWVGPGLPRVLHKLLDLMHHLAHLVLRRLLLHGDMLFLVLAVRTVANLLVFGHGVLIVAFLLGLNWDTLLIVVLLLVHAVLLHLLHLSHHSWVLHHGLLLHLILLLLHGQLHLLLFFRAHLLLLLHELLLVHLVIHVLLLLHHHLLLLHVHLIHITRLLLELLLLHLLLLLHVLLLHLLLLLRHLTGRHLLLLRRGLLLLSIVFDLLAICSLLGGFLLLRGALFRLHFSLLTWRGFLLLLTFLIGWGHLLLLLFSVHVAVSISSSKFIDLYSRLV